jgi:hypothetical protein
VFAVAVGFDFLGTEKIDSDTGGLEIGAALPPEAVHGFSDTGLRAAESGADELAIGRVEAFKLLGYRDAAYVNTTATGGIGLVHQDPLEEGVAGTRLAGRSHSGLILADDLPDVVNRYAT